MPKRLTKKKIERYLKRGSECPRCGENVPIEGVESVVVEGNKASQDMHCMNCDLWWTDEYTLSKIWVGAGDLPPGMYEEEKKKHYAELAKEGSRK